MSISERLSVKAVDFSVDRQAGFEFPLGQPFSISASRVGYHDESRRFRLEIELHEAQTKDIVLENMRRGILALVIGDYTEPGLTLDSEPCANASLIDVDLKLGTFRATSSLVGLPPLFVRETSRFAAASCPFPPRDREPFASASMDMEGIADTLRWGHPLDERTLFSDTRTIPADCGMEMDATGSLVVAERIGPTSDLPASASISDIVQLQIAALLASARRLPSERAIVSLSGGLDSRTALLALLQAGRRPNCVSMAGTKRSLDARLASEFCAAYGLSHSIIELDDGYLNDLHGLALDAAAITGGVASLAQTVDLYVARQLSGSAQVRISGNLGNQVGRGGVESLSANSIVEEGFTEVVRSALSRRPLVPWFLPRIHGKNFGDVLFRQEVHYWSIANYAIGSSTALQLSPYADARLIQLATDLYARQPQFDQPSREYMRRRDIRHRIKGPPLAESFQRSFIVKADTRGTSVPFNWGWRSGGGWSPKWVLAATLGAADAAIIKMASKSKTLAPHLRRLSMRLGRPSALVAWQDVLRTHLRSLTYDVLLSRNVLASGVFEPTALRRLLDAHFAGASNHHVTIFRALEIGLGIHQRGSAYERASSANS